MKYAIFQQSLVISRLHEETIAQVRREILFSHLEGQIFGPSLVAGEDILGRLAQVVAPAAVVAAQMRFSDHGHQLRGALLVTVQQRPEQDWTVEAKRSRPDLWVDILTKA